MRDTLLSGVSHIGWRFSAVPWGGAWWLGKPPGMEIISHTTGRRMAT